MRRSFLEGAHPFVQVVFLVFLMLTTFLILTFLGMLLAIPLFGLKFEMVLQLLQTPPGNDNLALLKYVQFLQVLSLFLVPSILFILLSGKRVKEYLGLSRAVPGRAVAWTVLLVLALMPVNNFLSAWNAHLHLPEVLAPLERMIREMEKNADLLTKAFLRMDSWWDYGVNMLLIAVMAAIAEELTFRGVLQPIFIRWTKNPHAGVFIAGAVFSFFHFQFLGFFPRWLLGIILGYLYLWSDTLKLPVLMHFLNNGVAVSAYWFLRAQQVKYLDQIGTGEPELPHPSNPFLLSGIGVVIVSLYFIRRSLMRKSSPK